MSRAACAASAAASWVMASRNTSTPGKVPYLIRAPCCTPSTAPPESIRASGEAVVVEGYLDALRAHQAGFDNVVASLGTAITVRQLGLLARLRTTEGGAPRVVLALDADPAGARAAAEAGVRATVALRQPQRAAR